MQILVPSTNFQPSASTSDSDALYHIVRRLESISIPQATDRDQPAPPSSNFQTPSTHQGEVPFHQSDTDSEAYPAHIFEATIQCGSPALGDRTQFYPLWHRILAYWFPRSAGFKIEEDWQPAFLGDLQQQLSTNMVVLYRELPIVLLYLKDSQDYRGGLPQRKLRQAANRAFDSISVWSGQPALCVIAAMDTRWSSFIRSTDMTSRMVEEVVGYDWYGDFDDEVWSVSSYQAFKQYFNILKASLA